MKAKTRRMVDGNAVVDVVMQAFDRERFPWISEQRPIAYRERERAALSSAILLASMQVGTRRRRAEGQKADIIAVKLLDAGYSGTPRAKVAGRSSVPAIGTFYHRPKANGVTDGHPIEAAADYLVRTAEDEAVVIACRMSNSFLNSRKRITKEAIPIARGWRDLLGPEKTSTVLVLVLGGVYETKTLDGAQDNGLILHWFHDLDIFAGSLPSFPFRA